MQRGDLHWLSEFTLVLADIATLDPASVLAQATIALTPDSENNLSGKVDGGYNLSGKTGIISGQFHGTLNGSVSQPTLVLDRSARQPPPAPYGNPALSETVPPPPPAGGIDESSLNFAPYTDPGAKITIPVRRQVDKGNHLCSAHRALRRTGTPLQFNSRTGSRPGVAVVLV